MNGPAAMIWKKGSWKRWGRTSISSAGDRYSCRKAWQQCEVTIQRDAIPLIPYHQHILLCGDTSAHSTSLREREVDVAMTGDVGVPVVVQSAFLSLSPLLDGVKGLRWANGSLLTSMLSVREETFIKAEFPPLTTYLWICSSGAHVRSETTAWQWISRKMKSISIPLCHWCTWLSAIPFFELINLNTRGWLQVGYELILSKDIVWGF
jgi:hypothetical protein